jgi:magnesium-protoporphyrin IX monomethyl ester (oxidative) cyclase
MKIILINPSSKGFYESENYSFFPIGIASLGSILVENGFDIKILDFQANPNLFEDELLFERELQQYNPDVIGIGCLFSYYFPQVKEISRKIKAINPEILVVIGGLHATIFYSRILAHVKSVDFVILGEGEKSLLHLCSKLKNGDKNFEDIDGIAYREDRGIKVIPKRNFINNLDELPLPAYSLFDLDKYYTHIRFRENNRGMYILSSRSCPYKCTFCSMFHSHGSRWRFRTHENVLDEVEFLYNKYHIRHFQFVDDNMTFSKERTIKIFNGIIDRKLKITFNFPNGVAIRTLDREIIERMKQAGCVEIGLAIESGSEYIRNKIMKKRLSNNKIFEIIELCNEYDIETFAFFILGMPEENHDTMEENIRFMNKLKGKLFVDYPSILFATPFPGTALYKQCIEENLIDEKTINQLIEGTYQVFDKPVIKLKALTEKELLEYRNNLWKIYIKQNIFRLARKFIRPTLYNYRVAKSVINRFL